METLPLQNIAEKLYLVEEEMLIYNILKEGSEFSRAEIDKKSGLNKSKTIRTINELINKSVVKKSGKGRGVRYRLK